MVVRLIVMGAIFIPLLHISAFISMLFLLPFMSIYDVFLGVGFDSFRVDAIANSMGFYLMGFVFKFSWGIYHLGEYLNKKILKFVVVESFVISTFVYFYHFFYFLTSSNIIIILVHNVAMAIVIYGISFVISEKL